MLNLIYYLDDFFAMSSADNTEALRPLFIALSGMSGWIAVVKLCAIVMPPTSLISHSATAPLLP